MRISVFGAIAFACAAAACGKDPAPAAPAGGVSGSSPAGSSPAAGALPALKVALVEPGAEPRTALRYHAKAGEKASHEIAQTQKDRSGDAGHLTVQNTTVSADSEVLSVDPSGKATVRISLHDVRAEIVGMPNARNPLAGARIRFGGRLSPLGRWTNGEIALDGELGAAGAGAPLDAFAQAIGRMTIPLPPDPVGVGARWTAEGPVAVFGTTLPVTSTVTLESVQDGVIVLHLTVAGVAKDLKLDMPPLVGDVVEISTEGEGRATISLAHVLPDAMDLATTARSKMRIRNSPDAAPRDLEVSGTSEMRVRRKD